MSIPVTCPSCLTRFNVSEKFAGKSGPCPKCQKTIKIPEKSEEVVIHAPEHSGPKDSKGQAVLKPLRRKEVALSLPIIMAAVISCLIIFGIALGLGLTGGEPPTALLAISSIGLAIPIAILGYWFLHDDELQGYGGRQLWIRGAVCALGFAATWGLYAFVPWYLSGSPMAEISAGEMALFVAIMIAMGTAVSVLALELEIVQGLLHYMLYFAISFVLAWLAGTQLAAPLSRQAVAIPTAPSLPPSPPGSGAQTQTTPAQPAQPRDVPGTGKKPNLLQ